MVDSYSVWLSILDVRGAQAAAALLLPLGLYVLISGLDDLFLDLVWLTRRFRRQPLPPPPPSLLDERRIAVYVPCWQEQEVIGRMVEHNLGSILYDSFEIFIGVYRNDEATRSAVRLLANRYEKVHLAEVPHDGPTSKADCLNWIHQAVLRYEEGSGVHFEAIVLHDAEDLIHPEEFSAINRYAAEYDMIQIPVLPLATSWREFTHGVYCDDFAEGQYKDLASRVELGGFLPGCGVGTAFRRSALDLIASRDSNRLFAPDCLTEDYENGYRVHELGLRQVLAPLGEAAGGLLATREYFPRDAASAIRQRSRWVTGNALQAWQRHGWGRWPQPYFFWRDRKGLWGNPASLLCNLLLLYGTVSGGIALAAGRPWLLLYYASALPLVPWLVQVNLLLLAGRTGVRGWTVSRLYGWPFACLVPLRMLWANWINFRATSRALAAFFRARLRRQPLVWVKTDHLYPARYAAEGRPPLGEVLVRSGYLEEEDLGRALATQPAGVLLGEYLVRQGLLNETQLMEALSLQQGLPCVELNPAEVAAGVARLLPRQVAREYRVLPFKVHEGGLCVASPEPPTERVQAELRRLCRLEIRFHLITPGQFDDLARRLL